MAVNREKYTKKNVCTLKVLQNLGIDGAVATIRMRTVIWGCVHLVYPSETGIYIVLF